jgi:ribonuclease HI
VLGHEGIVDNEMADQLARRGPEAACGISVGVTKKAVRDWMNRNRNKHWEAIIVLIQVKGFISGPSARRTEDLLKLNIDQLRWVIGLFTGHYHLKGHLFKLMIPLVKGA